MLGDRGEPIELSLASQSVSILRCFSAAFWWSLHTVKLAKMSFEDQKEGRDLVSVLSAPHLYTCILFLRATDVRRFPDCSAVLSAPWPLSRMRMSMENVRLQGFQWCLCEHSSVENVIYIKDTCKILCSWRLGLTQQTYLHTHSCIWKSLFYTHYLILQTELWQLSQVGWLNDLTSSLGGEMEE